MEAGDLLGIEAPGDEAGMTAAAAALRALGPKAVLVKGGHLEDAYSVDILDDGGALSAAIAALLGKGLPLRDAVRAAKAYLTDALRAADELRVGYGHGPVHHFHALWPDPASRKALSRP